MSGLSDHFSQCGRHVVTAAYIAHQLSISDRVDEFHLVGTRGARILQGLQAHAHDALTTIRPTFAIVDIGTNDISNGAPTVTVADAVVQLAHEIIDVFGARHVTVSSALHRSSPLDTNNRHINNLIDNYNNILRNFCDVEPLIDYHTHRGFWNTDTYTWSRDGLHPNTNVGRAKYKRSLRKAVNHALSVVHKPKWYSILSLLTECTALRRILFPAGVRPLLHVYTITSNLHNSANIKKKNFPRHISLSLHIELCTLPAVDNPYKHLIHTYISLTQIIHADHMIGHVFI